MKKIIRLAMLTLFCLSAKGQSNNFVKTETMLDAGGSNKITSVQYFDGVGRPSVAATTGLNANGTVGYTLQTYDMDGREEDSWLPGVSGTSPTYQSPVVVKQLSKSAHGGDTHPYLHAEYDALDRNTSLLQPGQWWHQNSKKVQKSYSTNTASSVRRYEVSASGDLLTNKKYYEAATLYVEETKDEDGKVVTIFTDFMGRKVLERRAGNNDTYFVYNSNSELCYVLSPMFQQDSNIGKYAYVYKYDKRSRCIYKKLPGCEPVSYWYDNADRQMFIQDDVLKKAGRCRFILYDVFDRPVLQGTTTSTPKNYTSAGATLSNKTGICNTGYTQASGVTLASPKLEKAIYYDNYDFLSYPAFKDCSNLAQMRKSSPLCATGFQTGVITTTTSEERLYSVSYYDIVGSPIDVRQTYPGNRLLVTRTGYSFTKKPKRVTYELRYDSKVDSMVVVNEYSKKNDALLTIDVSYNKGASHRVADLQYDNLGRLIKKKMPGSAGTLEYTYNVRSWITNISSKAFKEDLAYQPLANGNISQQKWVDGSTTTKRGYNFTYDALNRLTNGNYGEGDNLKTNTNRYSEKDIQYTANSAVTALKRYGKQNNNNYGLIDDLSMTLNGNRLSSVKDAAISLVYNNSFDFKKGTSSKAYEYNGNGALTYNPDKGATITYDLVGYMKKIDFGDSKITQYIYNSDGTKLKTSYTTGSVISTIEYIGPYLLSNGQMDKFLFDGGYITFSGSTPVFHYYITDHLGNNRNVLSEKGTIEQTTNYYPFGGIIGDLSKAPESQSYKYNGKEYDHQHGLDWYDYGARHYDAALCLFPAIDPLCEKYYNVSPYAYCANNPVNRIDPDGRDWFETEQGNLRWQPNVHSQSDLQEGYKYIGESLERNNATYRDDGTIMFPNESQAYERMAYQGRSSKSPNNPSGKEQMAFILNNGSVLVMPDNWNDSETSTFKQTGITRKNHVLIDKHGNKFGYVAQVHTHSLGADKGLSPEDKSFAKADPDISIFVMHGDGNVYGGYYSSRRQGIDIWAKNKPVPIKALIVGTRTLKQIADFYKDK